MTRFVDGIAALSLQRNGIDVLPTRARVALPPRFAGRGAGTAWVGDDGSRTLNEHSGRSPAPPVDATADHSGWSAPAATGAEAAADRDGPPSAATPSVTFDRPVLAAAPLRHVPASDAGTASPALAGERAEARSPAPAMPATHLASAQGRRSPPAQPDAGTSRPRAANSVPVATVDRSRPTGAAGLGAVPHAPLRESTVAERTGAGSDVRPVIHVTIDRIDVRAPALPARPAPARGRAQPQPSVSLADYLRGKGRTGSSS